MHRLGLPGGGPPSSVPWSRKKAIMSGTVTWPASQTQAGQVHAQRPRGLAGRFRPDGLVADDDAPLVDAMLEAPQPERLTAEDPASMPGLRDGDILAPHRGTAVPVAGGIAFE